MKTVFADLYWLTTRPSCRDLEVYYRVYHHSVT